MQALQRNMTHLQNTLMPQLQQSLQALRPQSPSPAQLQQPKQQLESVVQELERLSSFAEHIASGEKLNDVAQLSNKLLDQQNKLLAALDNLPKDFQGGQCAAGAAKTARFAAVAHARSHASHGTIAHDVAR